jgi:hypothetical protein
VTDATGPRGGLRVTSARLAILEAVRAGNHPGTDEIARAARDRVGYVTLQAVYEALNALTTAGLLRRIEPAGARPATSPGPATTISTSCAAGAARSPTLGELRRPVTNTFCPVGRFSP